jgi:hypothetical protein
MLPSPSPSPFAYIGRILSSSPTTAPSDNKEEEEEDEFQEDRPRQTIDNAVENKTERCARPLECPMCSLRLKTPCMVPLDFESCPRQSHVLQLSPLHHGMSQHRRLGIPLAGFDRSLNSPSGPTAFPSGINFDLLADGFFTETFSALPIDTSIYTPTDTSPAPSSPDTSVDTSRPLSFFRDCTIRTYSNA